MWGCSNNEHGSVAIPILGMIAALTILAGFSLGRAPLALRASARAVSSARAAGELDAGVTELGLLLRFGHHPDPARPLLDFAPGASLAIRSDGRLDRAPVPLRSIQFPGGRRWAAGAGGVEAPLAGWSGLRVARLELRPEADLGSFGEGASHRVMGLLALGLSDPGGVIREQQVRVVLNLPAGPGTANPAAEIRLALDDPARSSYYAVEGVLEGARAFGFAAPEAAPEDRARTLVLVADCAGKDCESLGGMAVGCPASAPAVQGAVFQRVAERPDAPDDARWQLARGRGAEPESAPADACWITVAGETRRCASAAGSARDLEPPVGSGDDRVRLYDEQTPEGQPVCVAGSGATCQVSCRLPART